MRLNSQHSGHLETYSYTNDYCCLREWNDIFALTYNEISFTFIALTGKSARIVVAIHLTAVVLIVKGR